MLNPLWQVYVSTSSNLNLLNQNRNSTIAALHQGREFILDRKK